MAATDPKADYAAHLNHVISDLGRLSALQDSGMLDFEISIALDRLTRIASHLLSAPVALISLVGGDFQFFKSAQGLGDLMPEGRRTPLSHSFCQHVVASGQAFVVDNARGHPLVEDNFAIDELKVEAYLGIPLEMPGGFIMGSLCVIDDRPRHWSEKDVAILSELANLVMLDIDLQKEIERRITVEASLRESETRFRQVADNIEGLVFQRRKDVDGGFSYCFFGNSDDSSLDWRKAGEDNPMPSRFGAVHPDDRARVRAELESSVRNETDVTIEYRTVTKTGEIKFVRSQSRVRRTDEGTVLWDGAIFDVTDLTLARQKAEAAVASQRRMLSNINHDLRNPLTAIIGFSEALGEPLPSQQVLKHAASINKASQAMLGMANQLINEASMETGVVTLDPKPLVIAQLIEDSVSLLSGQAVGKSLTLMQHIDPETPAMMEADPARLQEVLVNLIANAVKYTNAGTVAVHAMPTRRGGAMAIRFEIRDTGIGISAADCESIFERNFRVGAGDGNPESQGLGLSIVQQLTEAMGGSIGVESVPGKGSVFWLELPSGGDAEQQNAVRVAGVAARRKSILVVDDLAVNRKLVADILGEQGYAVICVDNGAEAVNAMRTLQFDLVFMDMKMPVLDGRAATKAIRALPAPASGVPIIALTADDKSLTPAGYEALGFDQVLSKPFKIETVLQTAEQWTQSARSVQTV